MFRQTRTRNEEEGKVDEGGPALQPTDVIVGRGKGAYQSDGNRRFTQTIRSFLPVYNQAETTQEKVQVTNSIVAHIKSNGGRFLRIDNKGKLHAVPDKEARIKVAQAIRHQRRLIEEGKVSEASSTTGMTSDTAGRVPSQSGPRSGRGGTRSSRARAEQASRRRSSAREASQRSSARGGANNVAEVAPNLPQEAAVASALSSLAQQQQPLMGVGRPPVWDGNAVGSAAAAPVPEAVAQPVNNSFSMYPGLDSSLADNLNNMQIDMMNVGSGMVSHPDALLGQQMANPSQVMFTFPGGNMENHLQAGVNAEQPSYPNLTGRDAEIDEVISGNFSFSSLEEKNVASM